MGNTLSSRGTKSEVSKLSTPNKIDPASVEASVFSTARALVTEAKKYSPKLKDFAKFHALVEAVVERQGNAYPAAEPQREKAAPAFLRWCAKNHIQIASGVEIAVYSNAGLGLVATDKIKADDLVVAVPYSSMLSSKMASEDFGELIDKSTVDRCWLQVPMALKLVSERLNRSSSPWCQYIDVIPKKLAHPLFFTPEDFGYLIGSPSYEEGLNLYYEIVAQYGLLYHEVYRAWLHGKFYKNLTPSNFTLDSYRWGMAMALTRSLKVEDNGEAVTVLVPYWDLCNNGEETLFTRVEMTPSEGYDPALYAYASRDIEAGEQLMICYRESSTPVEYFTIWGISLVEYFSPIKVKVSAVDRNHRTKMSHLENMDMKPPVNLKIYPNNIPLNSADLKALLIISATTDDLNTGKVSQETWRRAWSHVNKRISRRLNGYQFLSGNPSETPPKPANCGQQTTLAYNLAVAETEVLRKALATSERLLNYSPADLGYHSLFSIGGQSEAARLSVASSNEADQVTLSSAGGELEGFGQRPGQESGYARESIQEESVRSVPVQA